MLGIIILHLYDDVHVYTQCIDLPLSSQVSFSLEGGSEVFVDVHSHLQEKADALEALGFPITNVSQSESCDIM